MASINFVVPKLAERTFSGGIYCVMRHAVGLQQRGHKVSVVPTLPSPRPLWVDGDFGWLPDGSSKANRKRVWREFAALLKLPGAGRAKDIKSRELKQRLVTALGYTAPRMLSPLMQRALEVAYVAEHLPQADITIATAFETALAARLHGTGRKYYFAQHYEPYFAADLPNPELAELEAHGSYHLGLQMIANSSWLKRKLEQDEHLPNVLVCPNAIDLQIFSGSPKKSAESSEVRVISYGGRNATWKGFTDMAEAMKLARERCKDVHIRWQVYGAALLPPDNPIAAYEPLGFLQLPALADAYRAADFLLSASWYESFPLFPLEAMACGLPAITTQFGTEEYAVHGETAEVVQARNPTSIAEAIVTLTRDTDYRYQLAQVGQLKAQEFSWHTATDRMELALGLR